MDEDGTAWVLADLTAHGLSPEAWSRRVAEAAALYGASRVVAEKNQGGDMIASVLRAVDADLPISLVVAAVLVNVADGEVLFVGRSSVPTTRG